MTADADRALSPVPLMQLATAFWAFKTLATAHELDLFSLLSGTAGVNAEGLAEMLDIEERPARRLGDGACQRDRQQNHRRRQQEIKERELGGQNPRAHRLAALGREEMLRQQKSADDGEQLDVRLRAGQTRDESAPKLIHAVALPG